MKTCCPLGHRLRNVLRSVLVLVLPRVLLKIIAPFFVRRTLKWFRYSVCVNFLWRLPLPTCLLLPTRTASVTVVIVVPIVRRVLTKGIKSTSPLSLPGTFPCPIIMIRFRLYPPSALTLKLWLQKQTCVPPPRVLPPNLPKVIRRVVAIIGTFLPTTFVPLSVTLRRAPFRHRTRLTVIPATMEIIGTIIPAVLKCLFTLILTMVQLVPPLWKH